MRVVHKGMILIITIFFLFGCSTTSIPKDKSQDKVLSESSVNWTNKDSQAMSRQMIKSMVFAPWKSKFQQQNGREPIVALGNIDIQSSEDIDIAGLMIEIEKELKKYLKDVVEVHETDRIDPESGEESANNKVAILEDKADFILSGTFSTKKSSISDNRVITYKLNLELWDMRSKETVWKQTLPKNKMIYPKIDKE